MSIAAILKADQKKLIGRAMNEFLAKGGEVRRIPTPTFFSESIRWAQTYGKKTVESRMKNAIAVSVTKTLSRNGAPR